MDKRLTIISVTGLVLFTLAGCATNLNASGADGNEVANRATANMPSVNSPTGAASLNPNFANQIALIRGKGYRVSGSSPDASVQTSSGGTLTAWIGTDEEDEHHQFVFFFLNGTYLGTDTAKPSVEIASAKAVGHGIAVTYPVYKKNDALANPTGTPVTITYTWNGSKLVPDRPYPNQFQASGVTAPAGTTNSTVHVTSYANSSQAANEISAIQTGNSYLTFQTNNPAVNLGLGISAKQDGGLDHYGLQWHEGNWTLETLWFGVNQGGQQMAKNIVAYLHTHMLPAPHDHGVIVVNSTDPNSSAIDPTTIIAWQEGNQVYQLKQSGNPVSALAAVINQHAQGSFEQTFKSAGASREVFLTPSVGFQITNLGGGASNFEYRFSKTTNGGKTWTTLSTGRYSDVEGISFIDDQTGFLLNNSPAYAITPDLFVTHDGGVTWSEQKLPIPSAYKNAYRASQYPIFFSTKVGFIPVYGEPTEQSTTRKFLYMLVTTNGGTSWTAWNGSSGGGLSWNVSGQKLTVTKGTQTITVNGLLGIWNVSTGY
ncbi:LppP/LprE family lipoprotein [Alicyclobacillus acidiphilus]|uniref:LppP/LprE family lipoprotein n=1 Tax=Alicyclobacillus acidiphilus TaxID=182455 RepID=UPI00082E1EAE|nr:LppP/LprE family lipoprotein [Alicyclobacillus acidiphilus]